MKKRRKRRKLKFWGVMFIIVILSVLTLFIYRVMRGQNELNNKASIDFNKLAKDNYNEYVKTNKDALLYDENDEKLGIIYKDNNLTLDGIKERKYKIKDANYYVDYEDVSKEEQITKNDHTEYTTYKNYIPYNINIITDDKYKLYKNDNTYIEINNQDEYIVLIKFPDKYGVEFNDQLFYINKDDVKEEKNASNSNVEIASSLPALNYHYTVNREAGELNECIQEICTEDTQVEEEIKYLSDNNYYSVTMRDVYLFTIGAINLPKHSVVITIDDGWYVGRMIGILEKYKMTGTLFLIGSLASPDAYRSEYLEIHSHSWDMHNIGVCSGHHGGAILCWSNDKILEDLRKSRESLNNTTVFCYPFYEYNTNAINMLKEAGFEMAFAGGERNIKVGDDLFKLPRYVIVNYTTMNQFIRYVS